MEADRYYQENKNGILQIKGDKEVLLCLSFQK